GFRQQTLLSNRDNISVAIQFGLERSLTQSSDLIIDPSLVVHFGIDALVAFANKARFNHTADRTVQSTGTHFDLALRIRLDLLHHAIPMSLFSRKRKEDVQYRRS